MTLLPLSSSGAWVDYVYAFVSVEAPPAADAVKFRWRMQAENAAEDVRVEEVEELTEIAADDLETAADAIRLRSNSPTKCRKKSCRKKTGSPPKPSCQQKTIRAIDEQEPAEFAEVAVTKAGPGFAKLFDGFAGLTSFYDQGAKVEPVMPPLASELPTAEPAAIEPVAEIERADAIEPAGH